MISLNESPTKKARFWQSFVRSLKGERRKRRRPGGTWRWNGLFWLQDPTTWGPVTRTQPDQGAFSGLWAIFQSFPLDGLMESPSTTIQVLLLNAFMFLDIVTIPSIVIPTGTPQGPFSLTITDRWTDTGLVSPLLTGAKRMWLGELIVLWWKGRHFATGFFYLIFQKATGIFSGIATLRHNDPAKNVALGPLEQW